MEKSERDALGLVKELTQIGISLSTEKDHAAVLELILKKAMDLTEADAGTLYICQEDQSLGFEIMHNRSLNIHQGGTSGKKIDLPALPLYDAKGKANDHLVSTRVALTGKSINIPDVYQEKRFDFSGTYLWDKKLAYHSQSFLTIPLKNHLQEIIGVLQLINAQDRNNGKIIPFSEEKQEIAECLASQSAITLSNKNLIAAQKKLFDSLIQLIAAAIDEKSPYTAGHCRRVPIIARMLADAACKVKKGPLKDFKLSDDEKYELEVAAWLHDCGKITTPEYVVDKATKLQTIFDKIHIIDARFEVLKRDAIIAALNNKAKIKDDTKLQKTLKQLDQERDFIRQCNIGKEFIHEEDIARIEKIAARRWGGPSGEKETLLSEDEVKNLKIARGTLSTTEREIINNHAKVTNKLLSSLPYPKHLRKVPIYAGAHHEKMDGTGYPQGLKAEEMPIQSRIIAIADVFEALTAHDRPYKKALKLSQALNILGKMKLEQHIDGNLFDIFMHEKLYLAYAKDYLDPALVDEITEETIPGYQAL